MHDELIERRLRAALRDEAARLPFTLTAAELERRAVLRGGGAGNRRLGLLLAAALGIGLVGFGSALGGLLPSQIEATPGPTAFLGPTAGPTTPVAADRLPELSELFPADDPAVAVAQAHGPAGGPSPLPEGVELAGATVGLGELGGSSAYEVTFACLGAGRLTLDVRVPASRGPLSGPDARCDAALHREMIRPTGVRHLAVHLSDRASWRIVVRRLDGVPQPPPPLPVPDLQPGDDEQELVRSQFKTPAEEGSVGLPHDGLALTSLDALPARPGYRVQLWCQDGAALRYIHPDPASEEFVVSTSTQVPCDGNVHELALGPEIYGTNVFLAATPGSQVAVLVTSPHPPISLANDRPGWQMSSGFGPHLDYEAGTQMVTGIGGEDGGPVLIVFACASTTATEISVEVGARSSETPETFTAACTPEGAETSQSFESDGISVDLTFTTTPGTWTAMSILIPESRRDR
jgi:hypothetical protein